MRRLDRYILAEILGPLALGFLVYTFILLIQVLFKSAELLIGSGVPVETIGRMLMLSLPWIVVMTIPMSFLFGILIGIGRLSTDSELIALRASGISLFSLYRPILLLSAILTGLNIYLMLEVLPPGNQALAKLKLEIVAQSLTDEVQPRIPHTGWEDKVLYVFESPPGEQEWRGVFLADAIPTGDTFLVVGERGKAYTDEETGRVILELDNTSYHNLDLQKPETYNLDRRDTARFVFTSREQQRATSISKSLREMRLRDLRRASKDPNLQEKHRNLANVEIHKRFGFPAACLVFGLLGLPLGFSNARGGRSAGFALSILVILVYYIIFNTGEEAARDGAVPAWLAVWLPNVLMLGAGLFLLARRNRDKSLMLQNVDRYIQQNLWSHFHRFKERSESRQRRKKELQKRRTQDRTGKRLVLRLPQFGLRFPNTVDRYVLKSFFRVFGIAVFSGLTVYLAADLTENVEDILQNEVSSQIVFSYYQYKSFAILYEIMPIIVLITTLTSFGLLSRTNELTALKAAGVSVFRLAVPVVLASGLIAGLCGVLQSEVLPAANSKVAEYQAVIKGREARPTARRADRQWLYGKGNQLYNYAFYDTERRELQNLQIFKFDENYRLIGRLRVERATHIEDEWWTFSKGWARTFDGAEMTGVSFFEDPMKYRLEEPPEYFAGGLTPPDEMDYAELSSYIGELHAAGQKVPELEVELHNKIAYPFISLVMALVGLPFAFKLGRRGALYGIGISILLGIALLLVIGIFTALGTNGILPPQLAIWSPAGIFAIFSLYSFLGVRS